MFLSGGTPTARRMLNTVESCGKTVMFLRNTPNNQHSTKIRKNISRSDVQITF